MVHSSRGAARADHPADPTPPRRRLPPGLPDRAGHGGPRRIVALYPSRITSDQIAVGLEPVGATTNAFNGPTGFSPLWGDAATRMPPAGEIGTPDLERVAALAPDLILVSTAHNEFDLRRQLGS